MTNTLFAECREIVKDLAGHEYLYFDQAVEIRTGPHSFHFYAWAVCVSPKDQLFVMDSTQEWHEVEVSDNHAHLVTGSLYQRLKMMRIHYRKAS